jgi:hypothetical protein
MKRCAHVERGQHGKGRGVRAAKGRAYVHANERGRDRGGMNIRPHGGRGACTYMPMIGGTNEGVHSSREEGIYGLPFSFAVTKSSPPGFLPSTCKVLCLGLWSLRELALQT